MVEISDPVGTTISPALPLGASICSWGPASPQAPNPFFFPLRRSSSSSSNPFHRRPLRQQRRRRPLRRPFRSSRRLFVAVVVHLSARRCCLRPSRGRRPRGTCSSRIWPPRRSAHLCRPSSSSRSEQLVRPPAGRHCGRLRSARRGSSAAPPSARRRCCRLPSTRPVADPAAGGGRHLPLRPLRPRPPSRSSTLPRLQLLGAARLHLPPSSAVLSAIPDLRPSLVLAHWKGGERLSASALPWCSVLLAQEGGVLCSALHL